MKHEVTEKCLETIFSFTRTEHGYHTSTCTSCIFLIEEKLNIEENIIQSNFVISNSMGLFNSESKMHVLKKKVVGTCKSLLHIHCF